jgi:RNA polymerase primary sigma factor
MPKVALRDTWCQCQPPGRPLVSVTQLYSDATGNDRHRRGRLLSASEEITLARRIERGDLAAKETMIERNLGLVNAIASSYRRSSVAFDDLVQEGTVGLIRAVERFDHRRGAKFSTYAGWWIRRSILDAIANSNVIRIPAKANRQLGAVRRAEAELERLAPHQASDGAIAEQTDLGVGTVRSLRAAARVTSSLDQPVGEDSTRLGELIGDNRAIDPLDSAIAREDHEMVSEMLRLLPERHRQVLVRRYGLHDECAQTHEEIGEWLGVGEERSRQLEREALHRLRSIAEGTKRAA